MKEKGFDEYYKKVPENLKNSLLEFRKTRNYKNLDHNGTSRRYYCTGSGSETLLLIPGGMRKAESIFAELEAFSKKYKVISPDLPVINDSDSILDGILEICKREKADKVNILGRSFGGTIVQGFASKYPETVKRLILCSTLYLDKNKLEDGKKSLKTFQSMKEGLIKFLVKPALFKIIKKDTGRDGKLYWKAYLDEFFDSVSSKELMVSQLSIGCGILSNYTLASEQIKKMGKRILIIYAENDSVVSKKEATVFDTLLPDAERKIFETGGHALFLTRKEEYFQVITDFIGKSAG